MKRIGYIVLSLVFAFSLVGCGSKESGKKEYLKENEIAKAYSNPQDYEGKYVKLTGKVFSSPEKDDKGIYFQMWGDPQNSDKNTVVGYADTKFEIKDGDYVKIDGKITGEFSGSNSFGGDISALQVEADKVEISNYQEVVAPSIKTVDNLNLKNSQNGVDIAVNKVEFAKNETRVYYSVTNNSGSSYSFYDYDIKLVQDGKQFDSGSNYEADYPSVNGNVVSGVSSEGIITFPEVSQKSFDLHFNAGYSDNFDLEFSEFTLKVEIK